MRIPGKYDADAVSRIVRRQPGESLTKQSFAKAADINEIVRRFGLTGQLPVASQRVPLNGDFCNAPDFQSSMNLLIAARERFDALPAKVRARFGQDPGQMIAFLENDANRDEAMKLGLIERPPERTRDVVQAVDELASKLVPPKA